MGSATKCKYVCFFSCAYDLFELVNTDLMLLVIALKVMLRSNFQFISFKKVISNRSILFSVFSWRVSVLVKYNEDDDPTYMCDRKRVLMLWLHEISEWIPNLWAWNINWWFLGPGNKEETVFSYFPNNVHGSRERTSSSS